MKKRIFLSVILSSILTLAVTPVLAEEIGKLKAAGIGISLQDVGAKQYKLVLNGPSASSKLNAEVFAIENPTRLVVDVDSFSAKRGQVKKVVSSEVSKVRVGVHPSKLRLVIDSSSATVPSFLVSKKGDSLVVDFSFSSLTPEELLAKVSEPEVPEILTGDIVNPTVEKEPTDFSATEPELPKTKKGDPFHFLNEMGEQAQSENKKTEAPAEVEKEPKEEPKPDPVVEKKPADTEKKKARGPQIVNWETMTSRNSNKPKKKDPEVRKQPDKIAKMLAEPKDEPVDIKPVANPRLKQILFKRVDNGAGAALVLNVEGLGEYSLSRANASSYRLQLMKVQLAGKHLELPHFPPDFVSGIEVVVVEEKGEDIVVEIFLEDGIRLRPYRKAGNLWVRVLN